MGYLGNENTVTGTQNSKRIVVEATPNQTISTVTGGYTIGQLDVYRNGVKLAGASDFTSIQIGKQNQLKPLSLEVNVTASENISASGDIQSLTGSFEI